MTDIKPSWFKRLWDWHADEGPTGNAHEDIPLMIAVKLAQRNDTWEPFTQAEFDEATSGRDAYVTIDDLMSHGHAIQADPGERTSATRFCLTEAAIERCYVHSTTLPL